MQKSKECVSVAIFPIPHEAKRRSKKNGNMFRWPKSKCHKNYITVMIRTYCHMGSLLTSFCKNPRQPYSSNNPQVNANKHNIPIYSMFSLSRYMLFPYAIMPKPWQYCPANKRKPPPDEVTVILAFVGCS